MSGTGASTRWPCPHCGETHARAVHRTLHIGRLHPDRMDEAEVNDFLAAKQAEEEWTRTFRMHVIATFAALPVVLLYILTAALNMEMNGNPAYPIMLLPGVVMFCALIYGMTFSRLSHKATHGTDRPLP